MRHILQRLFRLAVAIGLGFGLTLPLAFAGGTGSSTLQLPSWLTTFNGRFRTYEFQRVHNGNVDTPPVKSALATLARLFIQTQSFHGVSAGLGLYGVSDMGLSPEVARRDTSLMGTRNTFATPGQAFLQYRWRSLTVRAGNQLLHSPWVSPSDSRIIPATYQALSVRVEPMKGFSLEAAYWERWRGWGTPNFTATNLYGEHTPGSWYAGGRYKGNIGRGHLDLQAWHYGFTDIAAMNYVQGSYTLGTGTGWSPVIGAQYAHETDSGTALLGRIDASVYGLLAGVKHGAGTYTLAYDKIPSHAGAFQNGNIVSPYSNPYNSGPLYTNSMTHGLISQFTTGNAWKFKAVYWLGAGRVWRLIGSYASYQQDQYLHTSQTGNPWEVDFDATYFVRHGSFGGLSLRDRIGLFTYPGAPRPFIYNRIQLQYDF